jgi:putative endonuclease
MFWIYILKCRDNSYYTGHTDNLENRLYQHQNKLIPGCYTSSKLPVELVYSQGVVTREEALTAEQQIKGWSRRKKEALIKEDWTTLSDYSKRSK